MDGETLRLEVTGGIAEITLDRPERRNAFTGAMGAELSDAYRACDEDDDVRAVVLTGAPPAFCAGADLKSGGDTFAGTAEGFSAGGASFERSAAEIGRAETELHRTLMAHDDAREGVRAFLDQRDPEWTGRASALDY